MTLASSVASTPEAERNFIRNVRIVESLQLKDLIMEKARYSEDKSVREQALLALQKLMIQNWQSI